MVSCYLYFIKFQFWHGYKRFFTVELGLFRISDKGAGAIKTCVNIMGAQQFVSMYDFANIVRLCSKK